MESEQPKHSYVIEEQCKSLFHVAKEFIKEKKHFKAVRSLKEILKFGIDKYEQEACELIVSCYEELEDEDNIIYWLQKLDEAYEKTGDQIMKRLKKCEEEIEKQKEEAMTEQEKKERRQKEEFEENKKKAEAHQKFTQGLQKELEEKPQSIDIILKLVQIYESNSNYDKAAKKFAVLCRLEPNNLRYHEKYAYHLVQSRYGKDAIIALNKAQAIDSNWKQTLCLQRGEIYLKMGKYNESIKNLQEVIKRNSKCEPAFYAMGKAFKENCQYEQAIKAFLQCVQLNPKHSFAHSFLAQCYYINRQYFKYEQRLNILKKLQASQHFIAFLQGKVLQYSLEFQKSNECLLQLLNAKIFAQLKAEIYRAIAYNYQVLQYLPTSNLWYYRALSINRVSIMHTMEIELNWMHIQLTVKYPSIKYTSLQNLMNINDLKSHYQFYIRQLQICEMTKQYERVDDVYFAISDELNLFLLDKQITARVLLISAFKAKGKIDICHQMYNETYEMMVESFTPSTIVVLHAEFKRLIELSLDFKFESNAVNLLARMDEFIKELKEEGYGLKARNIEKCMEDVRIKVEKAVS